MFENLYFSKPVNVTLLCLYLISTVMGIAGGLSVWIILLRRRRLRNPINYMLLHMSLSDIIASVSLYLYIFILDPGTVSDSPRVLELLCSLTVGLSPFFLAAASSFFMICAMSYYRYVMIRYPMRRSLRFKGRGVMVISIGSWLFSLAGMFPSMISWKYVREERNCFWDWKNINSFAYRMVLLFIIVTPLVFLILSLLAIFVRARKSVDPNNSMQVLSRSRLRRAGKMVGLLILLFVVCWAPFAMYWMYAGTLSFQKRDAASGYLHSFRWKRITLLFCQLNYTLNSVVYIYCSAELKLEAKQLATAIWSRASCC